MFIEIQANRTDLRYKIFIFLLDWVSNNFFILDHKQCTWQQNHPFRQRDINNRLFHYWREQCFSRNFLCFNCHINIKIMLASTSPFPVFVFKVEFNYNDMKTYFQHMKIVHRNETLFTSRKINKYVVPSFFVFFKHKWKRNNRGNIAWLNFK